MGGMYSPDERDNLHNEAQEDSYESLYGETYEQTCANYSPWQAEQDHNDYEFNARFDYVSEAYGAEARLMAEDAAQESYYDALDSGFEGTFKEWKAEQAVKYALYRLSPEFEKSMDEIPF